MKIVEELVENCVNLDQFLFNQICSDEYRYRSTVNRESQRENKMPVADASNVENLLFLPIHQ